MVKFKVAVLSLLGGINAAIDLFIPIMIMRLIVVSGDINHLNAFVLYSLGGLASVFRAIKTGWLKK